MTERPTPPLTVRERAALPLLVATMIAIVASGLLCEEDQLPLAAVGCALALALTLWCVAPPKRSRRRGR